MWGEYHRRSSVDCDILSLIISGGRKLLCLAIRIILCLLSLFCFAIVQGMPLKLICLRLCRVGLLILLERFFFSPLFDAACTTPASPPSPAFRQAWLLQHAGAGSGNRHNVNSHTPKPSHRSSFLLSSRTPETNTVKRGVVLHTDPTARRHRPFRHYHSITEDSPSTQNRHFQADHGH